VTERSSLQDLASDLRMLLLDVDGVMTDGGIILIGQGEEAKRFDVQDGMGVNMLRAAGLMVGIVTSRTSDVVQRRANELNIDELFQGVKDKTAILDILRDKHGIEPAQTAFVGDDLQDIPLLRRVGIAIAVANAVSEVKICCDYVTRAEGGHGAVREAAEWLLELRGYKERIVQSITGQEPVSQ
jgi:3-deoxy-D-manno-octulosonate 8-phosphate phosphatase (KDO 8-P phosphatase)